MIIFKYGENNKNSTARTYCLPQNEISQDIEKNDGYSRSVVEKEEKRVQKRL
jgi:hypothetical protein